MNAWWDGAGHWGEGVSLPKFTLKLLGRFELSGPEGPIELPNKKLAALVAYLACCAPKPQSREKLATLLWGSHFETQARQNLRQALFRLRRTLGHDALIGDGDEIALAPAIVDCDAARLDALSSEGSRASLAAAADLYQDPLLAEMNIAEEAWADWLGTERRRLEGLALDAMIRHGELALQSGDAESALKAAYRAVAVNALREDAHRLIVQALAITGRKAEALRHYQDLVAVLKRELNTEPDAVTSSLVADLRSTQALSESPAAGGNAKSEPPQSGNEPSPARAVRSVGLEQRQLTIMVCNMASQGPLSTRLEPEDLHDLITAFQGKVADTVVRFDGYVAQDRGNGVLVYFGYPVAHEHDAEQAVRASLAVREAVSALSAPCGMTLQASAGIATGVVVVGERPGIGDTRQHVAIGEVPSIATRLQAVAGPGEIVIADSTRRLVGRMFDCRALPSVEAWRVLGETVGVSRFEARREGTLTPLVGRQEEIDLLLRRWQEVRLGSGRVVLLSGEPGIGKSRIAESLLARLEGEPHARLRYFCSPHHVHSPLYPFVVQLKQAAGFEPGGAGEKIDRLEALLKPTSRNVPQDVALIAELLSVPTDGRYPALTVSPQQKREMTFTALVDQLGGMAADGPVLIVFEDIHWIDPTSLDLLGQLIACAANLPLLLVATMRPEFQPAWVGEPHVTMLPLRRLGHRDSAALIGGVTKGKRLPEEILEQILAHTDGVPLFIEELTSTLLEGGLLRETSDRYELNGPLLPLAIPTTLRASLVARLDRLGPGKDVAVIGAAIGREFSHELIGAVSALAPIDLDAGLERLTGSGLISRRGTPPDATYSFKHALVQDAAYATMLKSGRRQLHARVAKMLIERFPAIAESQPEVVAHHFTEAGLAAEAIGYWVKAGRLAQARWANHEAVGSFQRALSLIEALPEGRATLEQRFEIYLELRTVLNLLGEAQAMLKLLGEAEQLAERLSDDNRRGRVCIFMTHLQSRLGDPNEALASGTRALEIAKRLGDPRLRILATTYLAQTHYFQGKYERTAVLAADNLKGLPSEWVSEDFGLVCPPSIADRCSLILSLAELGRFADAVEPEAEAMRLATLSGNAFSIGWTHLAAAWVRLVRGDWERARLLVEHATTVLTKGNVVSLRSLSVGFSSWVLAQHDEGIKAVSRLNEGEQLLRRQAASGYIGDLGWGYLPLGRAALRAGQLDDSWRLACSALKFSPRQPGFAAHAMHLLGEVAAHPSRFDAGNGEAHYRKALVLAEELEMRPLIAHCHLGLGKLYRRIGTRERAQEHVATATTMYRKMDMPFWLEQAEAEMRELR